MTLLSRDPATWSQFMLDTRKPQKNPLVLLMQLFPHLNSSAEVDAVAKVLLDGGSLKCAVAKSSQGAIQPPPWHRNVWLKSGWSSIGSPEPLQTSMKTRAVSRVPSHQCRNCSRLTEWPYDFVVRIYQQANISGVCRTLRTCTYDFKLATYFQFPNI